MTTSLPAVARVILHLDMDAFYAAIEVREDPALRGRPLIIGHRGRRGVVSTCSYEARRFGVHSAMPSVTAERLCPQAVWLPVRMRLYREVSRRIRTILEEATPVIEPLSIDEAFLDMTGIDADLNAGRRTGRRLKDQIVTRERLTASVGVSANKYLAKLSSDLEKPDGLVVFPPDQVRERLWPLPVNRLWGVGPRTAAVLGGLGLTTIGDVAAHDRRRLESALGPKLAAHIGALARGADDRPVESRRQAKSVGEERTYAEDLRDPATIHRELLARCEGVARSLRDDGCRAGTIHLRVRTGDFRTRTRSITLPHPTDAAPTLLAAVTALLRDRIRLEGQGIRLLGVSASQFERGGRGGQLDLFTVSPGRPEERVSRAEDAVRKRFGENAVTRAGLIRPPHPK